MGAPITHTDGEKLWERLAKAVEIYAVVEGWPATVLALPSNMEDFLREQFVDLPSMGFGTPAAPTRPPTLLGCAILWDSWFFACGKEELQTLHALLQASVPEDRIAYNKLPYYRPRSIPVLKLD